MEYREKVAEFMHKAGTHPAWGINHCQRVYHMVPEISGAYVVDDEVIFAASMLHDVGSYPGYSLAHMDHALRSKGLSGNMLNNWGFPLLKLPLVLDAIENHMFYSEAGKSIEAILLRDSDILDLLGNIGLVRLFSLVGIDEWASTPEEAFERASTFAEALPGKVQTRLAKRIAVKRREESLRFLNGLKRQTVNYKFI